MNTFRKHERLTRRKEISALIRDGNTFQRHPFRILWSVSTNDPYSSFQMKAAFSVPRKKFKRAVRRNSIRRKMKEAFRLNKESFKKEMGHYPFSLSLLIIFTPRKEIEYTKINEGMRKTFQTLKKSIQKKHNS